MMTNNGIKIKLIKQHDNGTTGYWDLNAWITNGSFPLSVVFPAEYGNPNPKGLWLNIAYKYFVLPISITGNQSNMPEICKALLSYEESYANELLHTLTLCRRYSGENKALWQSPDRPWYETLNAWKKKYRVFAARGWVELFEQAQGKYAYVFEHLPTSLIINSETIPYIDVHAIQQSVKERFTILEGEYFITGAIKEDTATNR